MAKYRIAIETTQPQTVKGMLLHKALKSMNLDQSVIEDHILETDVDDPYPLIKHYVKQCNGQLSSWDEIRE